VRAIRTEDADAAKAAKAEQAALAFPEPPQDSP
jgi:hypothetical protein